MRHLAVITEHEMVALFLRAEIHSVRFKENILALLRRDGRDRRVIDEPDLANEEENTYRARLLGAWRGYKRHEGVFRFVPDDTTWNRYALGREELARVRYLNDDYWIEISGGTRWAMDAVGNIRAEIEVFGQSTRWALGLAPGSPS